MEKINILIDDIQQFGVESTEQYNRDREINKVEYHELINRINELEVDDFNSSEKFEYFSKYWNQDVRKTGRFVIENSFEGNSIDINSFLILSNDFLGLINWLKYNNIATTANS